MCLARRRNRNERLAILAVIGLVVFLNTITFYFQKTFVHQFEGQPTNILLVGSLEKLPVFLAVFVFLLTLTWYFGGGKVSWKIWYLICFAIISLILFWYSFVLFMPFIVIIPILSSPSESTPLTGFLMFPVMFVCWWLLAWIAAKVEKKHHLIAYLFLLLLMQVVVFYWDMFYLSSDYVRTHSILWSNHLFYIMIHMGIIGIMNCYLFSLSIVYYRESCYKSLANRSTPK